MEELYLQQNQIKEIKNLDKNLKLETLDLAMNKITKFEALDELPELRELWMNWNMLEDSEHNKDFLKKLKLKTVYLADNPLSNVDNYETLLTTSMPTLKQIDGNVLRPGGKFYHQRTPGIHSVIKKEMNPEAKKILE